MPLKIHVSTTVNRIFCFGFLNILCFVHCDFICEFICSRAWILRVFFYFIRKLKHIRNMDDIYSHFAATFVIDDMPHIAFIFYSPVDYMNVMLNYFILLLFRLLVFFFFIQNWKLYSVLLPHIKKVLILCNLMDSWF